MGKHYVDNKQLYQVLLDYKFARLEAEKKKKTPPPIPADGSDAKSSGRSRARCPGWKDTYLDMGQNLHTTVSWRGAVCGSVLRLVHSLIDWLVELFFDNAAPLKYFFDQKYSFE